jgi:hypothetical protein
MLDRCTVGLIVRVGQLQLRSTIFLHQRPPPPTQMYDGYLHSVIVNKTNKRRNLPPNAAYSSRSPDVLPLGSKSSYLSDKVVKSTEIQSIRTSKTEVDNFIDPAYTVLNAAVLPHSPSVDLLVE